MPLLHRKKITETSFTLLSVDQNFFAKITKKDKKGIYLSLKTKIVFDDLIKKLGKKACLDYGKIKIEVFNDLERPILSDSFKSTINFNRNQRLVDLNNDEQKDQYNDSKKRIQFNPKLESYLIGPKNVYDSQQKSLSSENTRVAYVEHDFSDKIIDIDTTSYSYYELKKTKHDNTTIDSFEDVDLLNVINRKLVEPTTKLGQKSYFQNFIESFVYNSGYTQPVYKKSLTSKKLTEIELTSKIVLPASFSKQSLRVKISLFKSRSSTGIALVNSIEKPEESVQLNLDLNRLLEADSCLLDYPTVTTQETTSRKNGERNFIIGVSCDTSDQDKIYSYNIYTKTVTSFGTTGTFNLVGSINGFAGKTNISIYAPLSIIRVVPVNKNNEEYGAFTNVVVGPGHDTLNKLSIVEQGFSSGNFKATIYNIPKRTSKISLYRRDCTNGSWTDFQRLSTITVAPGIKTTAINDYLYTPGKTFEYYVTTNQNNKEIFSNSIVVKHHRPLLSNIKISTNISNDGFFYATNNSDSTSDLLSFSFTVNTNVSQEFKETMGGIIKQQVPELWDRYLNPANVLTNPLENVYKQLFFHEVTRYNLNNKEVHTFDIISDQFEDTPTVRKQQNIPNLTRGHEYIYVVKTYVRDPLTMLPNIIKSGVNSAGENWFYSLYKWKNPEVMKSGRLYPDSVEEEFRTEIPTYDLLTCDYYGVTAIIKPEKSKSSKAIADAMTTRLDSETVKLKWKSSASYDSFLIAKLVNKKVTVIGRTKSNLFYHKLSSEDFGSISYAIIPISSDYSFDNPYISDSLFVDLKRENKISKRTSTTDY